MKTLRHKESNVPGQLLLLIPISSLLITMINYSRDAMVAKCSQVKAQLFDVSVPCC